MHNITIEFVLSLFILGAAVLAFIYHIVLYFFNRDRFLVHYLVYLFCTGIFLFVKTGLFAAFFGAYEQQYMLYAFKEAIQIVYLTSYFNFIVHAIEISKIKIPFLFRYWPATAAILLVYSFLYSLSKMFFPIDDYTIPFVVVRVFIFIITGVMLYQSYRLRQIRFQLIILYGCTLYFIFGLISFITNLYATDGMYIYPLEWLMIGSFVDIIFFSYAIGYRNKKEWESLNLTLLEEANKLIRLQQVIMEKQTELENERSRIAADMHDDLGSGLTKITYLSQMALNNSDAETNLMKIKTTASELVKNMSELIWVMKEENNTLEDLATYIKSFAADYFEGNNIEVRTEMPDFIKDTNISGNDRRDLFLSIKECFHNIVKHAGATKVLVRITLDTHLTITIEDDGIGLENSITAKKSNGNGIRNMKARAARMEGEVAFDTSNGTRICFRIPIERISKNQPLVSL